MPGVLWSLAELIIAAKCKSLAWQTREGERAIVAAAAAVVIRRAFMADRIYYERYKFESLERPALAPVFPCMILPGILYSMLNAVFPTVRSCSDSESGQD